MSGANRRVSAKALSLPTSLHFISPADPRPLGAYAGLATVYAGLFGGGLAAAVRNGRELPRSVSAGDIVLYGVATHRLSRLVSREKVARFVRAPFTVVEEEIDCPPAELEEHPR